MRSQMLTGRLSSLRLADLSKTVEVRFDSFYCILCVVLFSGVH